LLTAAGGCGVSGAYGWYAQRYETAARALARRDYPQALEQARSCLRLYSGSAAVHLLAARAARGLEAYDEAEQHLRAADRLSGPGTDSIRIEHLLIQAQRGDLSVAAGSYLVSCVEQAHPDSPFILEVLAKGYMRALRLPTALDVLNKWLALEPDQVAALLDRAWVLERLDSKDAAVADYRRAVELDPNGDAGRAELAELLLALSRPGEALPHFEYLQHRLGDSPPLLLGVARCRAGLGQLEEAQRLLDDLVRRDPGNAAAQIERGWLAWQGRQVAEAEKYLRRGVALDPLNARAQWLLSQCLEHQGQKQEAKELLERCQRRQADAYRLHEIVTQELDKRPDDVALQQEVGAILLRTGAAEDGLRWLHNVLQQVPGHRDTHQVLAEHYQRTGQPALAAQHRRRAGSGEERAGTSARR
jgi:tetratricopeptide (TPR) repeat protein